MGSQLAFIGLLAAALAFFLFSIIRIARNFKLTKPQPLGHWEHRVRRLVLDGFCQVKILRWPGSGITHAFVFWGFLVLLAGSIEMILDGLSGSERSLSVLGPAYHLLTAAADIFAAVVLAAVLALLVRRVALPPRRFHGIEMGNRSHVDALTALTLIALLMVSLLAMNALYCAIFSDAIKGWYPVSRLLAGHLLSLPASSLGRWYAFAWWSHITLILAFANLLPYSKHFHVFLSLPNVFLSRLEPLAKLDSMPEVARQVRMMLDPPQPGEVQSEPEPAPGRFGVKDVTDGTWQNYLNALTCTECGRCTAVCPAHITGKKLSPRKIFIDFRARMKEKAGRIRTPLPDDGKTLLRDYVSEEEIWACTTCNACAQECPVDINHPTLIVDLRRYLAMEEGAVPGGLNAVFANIENNGAPWKYSREDRLNWAAGLALPLMSDKAGRNEKPEYLFWVGCAGAFDDRYRKVARAFAKILLHCGVDFAVLGAEESCTGDPARRAGNEMLFQMQALSNMRLLDGYGVQKIITLCPHCYNSFANEYSELGGQYRVIHHTQFLKKLLDEGKLPSVAEVFHDSPITYHDPCYLGRGTGEYDSARRVIDALGARRVEMPRSRSFALCCGAGGAQMFKEAEPGSKEIYLERADQVLATHTSIVATSCPFCMTMLTDGIRCRNQEEAVKNYDIAELVAAALKI